MSQEIVQWVGDGQLSVTRRVADGVLWQCQLQGLQFCLS